MKKSSSLLLLTSLWTIVLTCLIQVSLLAQSLTDAQQQGLNSPVLFMNASVDRAGKVMEGLKDFYDQIQDVRKNNRVSLRPYRCASELPEYEYNQVAQKSAGLGEVKGKLMRAKAAEVWKALEQMDEHCKALEVYIRLGDYKQDAYARYDELISQIQKDFDLIRAKQASLQEEVYHQYRQLQPYNNNNVYHRLEKDMLAVLSNNRNLLQTWSYHFDDQVATNFPTETLIESINEFTTFPMEGARNA